MWNVGRCNEVDCHDVDVLMSGKQQLPDDVLIDLVIEGSGEVGEGKRVQKGLKLCVAHR